MENLPLLTLIELHHRQTTEIWGCLQDLMISSECRSGNASSILFIQWQDLEIYNNKIMNPTLVIHGIQLVHTKGTVMFWVHGISQGAAFPWKHTFLISMYSLPYANLIFYFLLFFRLGTATTMALFRDSLLFAFVLIASLVSTSAVSGTHILLEASEKTRERLLDSLLYRKPRHAIHPPLRNNSTYGPFSSV